MMTTSRSRSRSRSRSNSRSSRRRRWWQLMSQVLTRHPERRSRDVQHPNRRTCRFGCKKWTRRPPPLGRRRECKKRSRLCATRRENWMRSCRGRLNSTTGWLHRSGSRSGSGTSPSSSKRMSSGSGVSRSSRRATRRMRQASDVADLSGALAAHSCRHRVEQVV